MPLPDLIRGGADPIVKAGYSISIRKGTQPMAEQGTVQKKKKTSPGEFIRQVRSETSKVVWPTRQETVTTAIFVAIMVVILSVFFLGVDSLFSAVVSWLLTLA
jgi:preprotein translocase subunit SecE